MSALQRIDILNAYEADVHVWANPDPRGLDAWRDWSAIVDAEGEVVALVPPRDAEVFAKILNWAAETFRDDVTEPAP